MENYAETCRFVLSCNYSSKIIDPIQSRCAIYRFRPLTDEAISEEMARIAKKEGITIDEGAYLAIAYVSLGDMRKAINALQGAAIVSDHVTAENIYAITSNAKPEEITSLLSRCLEGEFETAERMLHALMYDKGIAPNELVNQLYREISRSTSLDRRLKVDLIDHLGEADFRMSEGADADIQMDALLARIVRSGMN